MNFKDFMTGFFIGTDGKPSSKRVTAFAFVALIWLIVLTVLAIGWLSIFKQVEVKDGSFRVIELAGTVILITLISAVLAIYGVQGWQANTTLKLNKPDDKPEQKKADEKQNP